MTKPPIDSSFTANVAELEVACGTGVVTRALAAALPDECSIVATDLNEAMVEHGQRVGIDRREMWRQADVMALPTVITTSSDDLSRPVSRSETYAVRVACDGTGLGGSERLLEARWPGESVRR
jgi:Methyltransferase domain